MGNSLYSDSIRVIESFTAVAINDYTNRIITGSSVRMLIDGKSVALRKEDGYHVFLGLNQEKYDLVVDSWLFQMQMVSVNLKGRERYEELIKVRLLPNERYKTGRDTTSISGRAEPNQQIHIMLQHLSKPYKLSEDYNGSEVISIYHSEDAYFDGKQFCIGNKNGEREEFRIREILTETATKSAYRKYKISDPLFGDYEKSNTVLKRIYTITADETGYFYFLLPEDAENDGVFEYYIAGEQENLHEKSFLPGCKNILELKSRE